MEFGTGKYPLSILEKVIISKLQLCLERYLRLHTNKNNVVDNQTKL
jgi:hypothetical protein